MTHFAKKKKLLSISRLAVEPARLRHSGYGAASQADLNLFAWPHGPGVGGLVTNLHILRRNRPQVGHDEALIASTRF
jgi:hypothetical protein